MPDGLKAAAPMKDLFGRDPVQMSIDLLREYEPPEGYYLADSGGKDSCCILELAKMAGVKFDAHYNVTTCDPPELVYFLRKHHPETKFDRSPTGHSIFTMIAKNGFMTRTAKWCCRLFKEYGGEGRRVIDGIRDAESARRKKRRQVEACRRKGTNKIFVHAIKHWTTAQVWDFIRDRGLPYCKLYDEGFSRLGCVICPESRDVARRMERWPGIWRLTHRAFLRLYERPGRLRLHQLFPSGEAMWQWWIDRDAPYPTGWDEDEAVAAMFRSEVPDA